MSANRMRRKSGFSVIALVTLIAFLVTTAVGPMPSLFAQTTAALELRPVPKAAEVSIPGEIGLVDDRYDSKDAGKLIVYLQDAHCIYEAQMNICKIIDYLQEEHDLTLVGLEGLEGEMPVAFFRAFPVKEIKESVTDDFMAKGEMSGAEKAAICNGKEAEYFGIEDMDVYYENKRAFIEAINGLEQIRDRLTYLKSSLHQISERIAGSKLREIYRNYEMFKADRIGLLEYAEFLVSVQDQLERYPMVSRLLEIKEREKEINFNFVDQQIGNIEREVERETKINDGDEALKKVEEKMAAYKRGEIKKDSYAFYLLARAKELGIYDETKIPHLLEYLDHVKEMEEVKSLELFDELDEMLKKSKERYLLTDDLIMLDRLYRHLEILEDLSKLELQREDLEYYLENMDEFSQNNFLSFFEKYLGPREAEGVILEEMLEPHRKFYDLAVKRDREMGERLLGKLAGEKRKFALVNIGGFHTDGFKELFKENGYSYVIVSPRITRIEEETPYRSVMFGKTVFASEKSGLSPERFVGVFRGIAERVVGGEFASQVENIPLVRNQWLENINRADASPEEKADYRNLVEVIFDAILRETELTPQELADRANRIADIFERFGDLKTEEVNRKINELSGELGGLAKEDTLTVEKIVKVFDKVLPVREAAAKSLGAEQVGKAAQEIGISREQLVALAGVLETQGSYGAIKEGHPLNPLKDRFINRLVDRGDIGGLFSRLGIKPKDKDLDQVVGVGVLQDSFRFVSRGELFKRLRGISGSVDRTYNLISKLAGAGIYPDQVETILDTHREKGFTPSESMEFLNALAAGAAEIKPFGNIKRDDLIQTLVNLAAAGLRAQDLEESVRVTGAPGSGWLVRKIGPEEEGKAIAPQSLPSYEYFRMRNISLGEGIGSFGILNSIENNSIIRQIALDFARSLPKGTLTEQLGVKEALRIESDIEKAKAREERQRRLVKRTAEDFLRKIREAIEAGQIKGNNVLERWDIAEIGARQWIDNYFPSATPEVRRELTASVLTGIKRAKAGLESFSYMAPRNVNGFQNIAEFFSSEATRNAFIRRISSIFKEEAALGFLRKKFSVNPEGVFKQQFGNTADSYNQLPIIIERTSEEGFSVRLDNSVFNFWGENNPAVQGLITLIQEQLSNIRVQLNRADYDFSTRLPAGKEADIGLLRTGGQTSIPFVAGSKTFIIQNKSDGPYLKVYSNWDERRLDPGEIKLRVGENIFGRGRADMAAIFSETDFGSVSRNHFILNVAPPQGPLQPIALRDLGSTNGTWVTSTTRVQDIPEAVLRAVEEIRIRRFAAQTVNRVQIRINEIFRRFHQLLETESPEAWQKMSMDEKLERIKEMYDLIDEFKQISGGVSSLESFEMNIAQKKLLPAIQRNLGANAAEQISIPYKDDIRLVNDRYILRLAGQGYVRTVRQVLNVQPDDPVEKAESNMKLLSRRIHPDRFGRAAKEEVRDGVTVEQATKDIQGLLSSARDVIQARSLGRFNELPIVTGAGVFSAAQLSDAYSGKEVISGISKPKSAELVEWRYDMNEIDEAFRKRATGEVDPFEWNAKLKAFQKTLEGLDVLPEFTSRKANILQAAKSIRLKNFDAAFSNLRGQLVQFNRAVRRYNSNLADSPRWKQAEALEQTLRQVSNSVAAVDADRIVKMNARNLRRISSADDLVSIIDTGLEALIGRSKEINPVTNLAEFRNFNNIAADGLLNVLNELNNRLKKQFNEDILNTMVSVADAIFRFSNELNETGQSLSPEIMIRTSTVLSERLSRNPRLLRSALAQITILKGLSAKARIDESVIERLKRALDRLSSGERQKIVDALTSDMATDRLNTVADIYNRLGLNNIGARISNVASSRAKALRPSKAAATSPSPIPSGFSTKATGTSVSVGTPSVAPPKGPIGIGLVDSADAAILGSPDGFIGELARKFGDANFNTGVQRVSGTEFRKIIDNIDRRFWTNKAVASIREKYLGDVIKTVSPQEKLGKPPARARILDNLITEVKNDSAINNLATGTRIALAKDLTNIISAVRDIVEGRSLGEITPDEVRQARLDAEKMSFSELLDKISTYRDNADLLRDYLEIDSRSGTTSEPFRLQSGAAARAQLFSEKSPISGRWSVKVSTLPINYHGVFGWRGASSSQIERAKKRWLDERVSAVRTAILDNDYARRNNLPQVFADFELSDDGIKITSKAVSRFDNMFLQAILEKNTEEVKKMMQDFADLQSELLERGWYLSDMKWDNIGYNENGELVVFDLDSMMRVPGVERKHPVPEDVLNKIPEAPDTAGPVLVLGTHSEPAYFLLTIFQNFQRLAKQLRKNLRDIDNFNEIWNESGIVNEVVKKLSDALEKTGLFKELNLAAPREISLTRLRNFQFSDLLRRASENDIANGTMPVSFLDIINEGVKRQGITEGFVRFVLRTFFGKSDETGVIVEGEIKRLWDDFPSILKNVSQKASKEERDRRERMRNRSEVVRERINFWQLYADNIGKTLEEVENSIERLQRLESFLNIYESERNNRVLEIRGYETQKELSLRSFRDIFNDIIRANEDAMYSVDGLRNNLERAYEFLEKNNFSQADSLLKNLQIQIERNPALQGRFLSAATQLGTMLDSIKQARNIVKFITKFGYLPEVAIDVSDYVLMARTGERINNYEKAQEQYGNAEFSVLALLDETEEADIVPDIKAYLVSNQEDFLQNLTQKQKVVANSLGRQMLPAFMGAFGGAVVAGIGEMTMGLGLIGLSIFTLATPFLLDQLFGRGSFFSRAADTVIGREGLGRPSLPGRVARKRLVDFKAKLERNDKLRGWNALRDIREAEDREEWAVALGNMTLAKLDLDSRNLTEDETKKALEIMGRWELNITKQQEAVTARSLGRGAILALTGTGMGAFATSLVGINLIGMGLSPALIVGGLWTLGIGGLVGIVLNQLVGIDTLVDRFMGAKLLPVRNIYKRLVSVGLDKANVDTKQIKDTLYKAARAKDANTARPYLENIDRILTRAVRQNKAARKVQRVFRENISAELGIALGRSLGEAPFEARSMGQEMPTAEQIEDQIAEKERRLDNIKRQFGVGKRIYSGKGAATVALLEPTFVDGRFGLDVVKVTPVYAAGVELNPDLTPGQADKFRKQRAPAIKSAARGKEIAFQGRRKIEKGGVLAETGNVTFAELPQDARREAFSGVLRKNLPFLNVDVADQLSVVKQEPVLSLSAALADLESRKKRLETEREDAVRNGQLFWAEGYTNKINEVKESIKDVITLFVDLAVRELGRSMPERNYSGFLNTDMQFRNVGFNADMQAVDFDFGNFFDLSRKLTPNAEVALPAFVSMFVGANTAWLANNLSESNEYVEHFFSEMKKLNLLSGLIEGVNPADYAEKAVEASKKFREGSIGRKEFRKALLGDLGIDYELFEPERELTDEQQVQKQRTVRKIRAIVKEATSPGLLDRIISILPNFLRRALRNFHRRDLRKKTESLKDRFPNISLEPLIDVITRSKKAEARRMVRGRRLTPLQEARIEQRVRQVVPLLVEEMESLAEELPNLRQLALTTRYMEEKIPPGVVQRRTNFMKTARELEEYFQTLNEQNRLAFLSSTGPTAEAIRGRIEDNLSSMERQRRAVLGLLDSQIKGYEEMEGGEIVADYFRNLKSEYERQMRDELNKFYGVLEYSARLAGDFTPPKTINLQTVARVGNFIENIDTNMDLANFEGAQTVYKELLDFFGSQRKRLSAAAPEARTALERLQEIVEVRYRMLETFEELEAAEISVAPPKVAERIPKADVTRIVNQWMKNMGAEGMSLGARQADLLENRMTEILDREPEATARGVLDALKRAAFYFLTAEAVRVAPPPDDEEPIEGFDYSTRVVLMGAYLQDNADKLADDALRKEFLKGLREYIRRALEYNFNKMGELAEELAGMREIDVEEFMDMMDRERIELPLTEEDLRDIVTNINDVIFVEAVPAARETIDRLNEINAFLSEQGLAREDLDKVTDFIAAEFKLDKPAILAVEHNALKKELIGRLAQMVNEGGKLVILYPLGKRSQLEFDDWIKALPLELKIRVKTLAYSEGQLSFKIGSELRGRDAEGKSLGIVSSLEIDEDELKTGGVGIAENVRGLRSMPSSVAVIPTVAVLKPELAQKEYGIKATEDERGNTKFPDIMDSLRAFLGKIVDKMRAQKIIKVAA